MSDIPTGLEDIVFEINKAVVIWAEPNRRRLLVGTRSAMAEMQKRTLAVAGL